MQEDPEKIEEAEPESDDALIARYRDRGDVASLDVLVRRHTGMLMRYLRGILNGKAEVEDAFQEVWLRVVRRSDAYRSRNFRGWLLRVAHNVAIDRYRRQRREVSLDAPDVGGGFAVDRVVCGDPSPRRAAVTHDALDRLAVMIRGLPDAQREVFLMRVVGDLSFKQIAKTLRIPLNTALGRMHYAVSKLREAIADEGEAWSGRIES